MAARAKPRLASVSSTAGRRFGGGVAQRQAAYFHGGRAGLAEHDVMQRNQLVLKLAGAVEGAAQANILEFGAEQGDVGDDRAAMPPPRAMLGQSALRHCPTAAARSCRRPGVRAAGAPVSRWRPSPR